MGRVSRVRVYGRPRKTIDPERLAQVLVVFVRHLARQRRDNAADEGGQPQARPDVPRPRASEEDGLP
jgi:hypothetical protein